jgi:hypothetical protein
MDRIAEKVGRGEGEVGRGKKFIWTGKWIVG